MSAHLPAEAIVVGTVRRQRCAWCGVLLEEVNLLNAHAFHPDNGDVVGIPSFSADAWGEFGGEPPHWSSYCQVGPEPPENACCRTAVEHPGGSHD